jgi:hypothetical protein
MPRASNVVSIVKDRARAAMQTVARPAARAQQAAPAQNSWGILLPTVTNAQDFITNSCSVKSCHSSRAKNIGVVPRHLCPSVLIRGKKMKER